MAAYGPEVQKETIRMNFVAGRHFADRLEMKLTERKYRLPLNCAAGGVIN